MVMTINIRLPTVGHLNVYMVNHWQPYTMSMTYRPKTIKQISLIT